MAVHTSMVNGNKVYWSSRRDKWIDAVGPTVRKYFEDFTGPATMIAADNAELAGWTMTPVAGGDAGDSTITSANEAGGAITVTVDALDTDGLNIQHNNVAWTITSGDPLYFSCKMKQVDATQSAFFLGLNVADTTLSAGTTYGISFRSADGAATVTGVCELNTAESTPVSSATVVAGTYSEFEFYYDGVTTVRMYVDDVLIETVTATANIPIDQPMCFSLEYITGENVANTCTLDWIKIIQCQ